MSTPLNWLARRLYWPKRKPTSRPPTPMSPAGTSVSAPTWRKSSDMKLWQKRMISFSLLPLGSKSEPPLPPPMGRPVSEFLKICSKPRNLRVERRDLGVEAHAALIGPDGRVELDAVAAVDAIVALVVHPGHAEEDRALGLGYALEDALRLVLGLGVDEGRYGLEDLVDGLEEFGLPGIARLSARPVPARCRGSCK